MPEITAKELNSNLAAGQSPLIIDVRGREDFSKSHLPGAFNIPLEELKQGELELDKTKETVFY